MFRQIIIWTAVAYGAFAGVLEAASIAIPLNASLPGIKAPAVAQLSFTGAHKQLDEGLAGLGLQFAPVFAGASGEYDWIYSPGEVPDFSVQVPDDKSITRAVLTAWDWFGKPVAVQELKSGAKETIHFDITGNGTWLVTLDAYGGSTPESLKSRLFRSFSVFPDSSASRDGWRKENRYWLGSCFYPNRYYRWGNFRYPDLTSTEVVDKLASLMARAGFTMVRIDYFPDVGGRDRAPLQETLQILNKYGISVDWKIDLKSSVFVGDTLEFDPKVFGPIGRNIDVLISDFWNVPDAKDMMVEIGNEPALNLFWAGTYEQYVYLYGYLYDKIRTANREIKIVHGGACYPGADVWNLKKDDPEYLKHEKDQSAFYNRLYNDIGDKGDFWPYHFHGNVGDWVQLNWIAGMHQKLQTMEPGVRLFQTEGGHCSWRPDIEADAWMNVLKKMFFSLATGDEGWLQFSLAGEPEAVRNGGGWGLLHSGTFAPRFQYGAWAAVTRWFSGCTVEQVLIPERQGDPLCFVYEFNHPEGKIICCYSDDKRQTVLRVKSDATQILSIDPMGNAVEMKGPDPAISLKKHPQYILLKGASEARCEL